MQTLTRSVTEQRSAFLTRSLGHPCCGPGGQCGHFAEISVTANNSLTEHLEVDRGKWPTGQVCKYLLQKSILEGILDRIAFG